MFHKSFFFILNNQKNCLSEFKRAINYGNRKSKLNSSFDNLIPKIQSVVSFEIGLVSNTLFCQIYRMFTCDIAPLKNTHCFHHSKQYWRILEVCVSQLFIWFELGFRFVLSVHDLVIWFMSLFHFSWDHLESIWKPLHWLMNFLSIVLPPFLVFRAAFHLLLECGNYAQKLFFNNTNCHFVLYCSQWVFFQ